MRGSSNTRLAPLTFWIAAFSVAIAVVGSSTLLFPGPDIGTAPSIPAGRDIVARIIAPVFQPSPARERGSPSASEAPESSPIVIIPDALPVTIPTGVSTERPTRGGEGDVTRRRPGGDGSPAALDGDGKANAKAKGQHGKGSKGESPRGKAIAGAKSQGHAYGHLKSTTSRGPKQPHVQPAKGHGKAKGHARAHARAGR